MKVNRIGARWGSLAGQQCAWERCERLAKQRGLCKAHYDKLLRDTADAHDPPDWDAPADCQCPPDRQQLEQCRLGNVLIDAYQCARCLKRIER